MSDKTSVTPYHRTGELNACPGCASERLEPLDYIRAPKRELPDEILLYVSGCAACGTIFVNPPPSAELLAQVYGEDGDWNEEQNESVEEIQSRIDQISAPSGEPAAHTHLGAVWRRVQQAHWPEPPRILDFGCGEGEAMRKFATLGWRPVGIDPATRHAITAFEMIDDIPAEPTFDVIFAKHVLEHTPNPLPILRQLRAALRPNGFLYCAQPCLNNLAVSGARRYCLNDPFHITGYTHRSIKQMLRTAGFEVESSFNLTRPDRFSVIARPATAPLASDDDPLAEARAEFLSLADPETANLPIRIRARLENNLQLRKKAKRLEDTRTPEELAAQRALKPVKIEKAQRKLQIKLDKEEAKARKAAKRDAQSST